MVHLLLFGGPRLERGGAPITGRPAQRHPLALMALLATAPGRSASRDWLIGYLWPEASTARARHRLNVALHVLRRFLGGDALLSRSDGVVLNPAAVWTDVGAFEEALGAGRLEEAVSLYSGPFLQGFFLSGAPEFERWVDSEQARLSALYTGALERLGAEAEQEGDAAAAVAWRRRLAAEDPLSTPVALSLMRALRDAGDLAGAVRHGRAHAARVAGELGLPPDPDVVALTEELTARSAARASPSRTDGGDPTASPTASAPAPAAKPPGRRGLRPLLAAAVTALLAALGLLAGRGGAAGHGNPGPGRVTVMAAVGGDAAPDDRRLARGLADEVGATLAVVPELRVAGSGDRVDGDRVEGDRVVRVGARRRGGRVLVVVELLKAGSDAVEWSDRFDRPQARPDRLVRELSLTIADSLRLRLAPYEPKVYTDSERAYDRFLQGVYLHRRVTEQDVWKALQLYREGYEEDEGFALAHAISANAYVDLVGLGLDPEVGFREARSHAMRALAIDSTLAEGHVALAMVALWHDWDFAEAERLLRRAIMLYPSLPQARSYYGHLLLRTGGSPEDALVHVRRALELDPLNAARSHTLARSLFLARRYRDVVDQHGVTRRLAPDRDLGAPESNLADAYRGLGRYQEAIEEYRRVRERSDTGPAAGLALAYVALGQADRARALLPALAARAEAGGLPPERMAAVYAGLGDADRAFEWLDRAYRERSGGILTLRVHPDLDPLRDDPRFEQLLRSVGLSP